MQRLPRPVQLPIPTGRRPSIGGLCRQATQETEVQIGLDKRKRRDVQRRLTGLGFDTKVNGRFDESTRTVITRWQEARGYPKTGFSIRCSRRC